MSSSDEYTNYSPRRSRSDSPSPLHDQPSGSNSRSRTRSVTPAPAVSVPIVNAKDLLPATLPSADRAQLRIILSTEEKSLYESMAKGTLCSKNSEWLDKVARVESVANRAPYLQRDFRKGEGQLVIREQSLIEQHDMLYRTLGVASLIGKDGHDQDQVKNCMSSLLSMMIHSVTVWRRWMALDNLGIPRQAIPGSSTMLLDLKEHDNPNKDGDKIHYLFGPVAEKDIERQIKDRKKAKERREADKPRFVTLFYGCTRENITTSPPLFIFPNPQHWLFRSSQSSYRQRPPQTSRNGDDRRKTTERPPKRKYEYRRDKGGPSTSKKSRKD
uniref:Gag protein n=1 Tax=Panagrolaimus sp. ES5 TaxID=591445 RepID=A0AC34F141_9BILA